MVMGAMGTSVGTVEQEIKVAEAALSSFKPECRIS
jgi:hypothetical protein